MESGVDSSRRQNLDTVRAGQQLRDGQEVETWELIIAGTTRIWVYNG
jgi:hypothetical protein